MKISHLVHRGRGRMIISVPAENKLDISEEDDEMPQD